MVFCGSNVASSSGGFTTLVLVLILSAANCWGGAMGSTDREGFIVRSEEEVKWLFEEWQVKHDKSYKDSGERRKRFEIFNDNLRYIDRRNRPGRNHSSTVGLNNLADLTNEEYRATYLGVKLNMSKLFLGGDHNWDLELPATTTEEEEEDQPQASVDWRVMGAVGPVKDQGGCACCWAFTAIATVEGITAIVTGDPVVTLSEQEIVDCAKQGTHCKPGWISRAHDYIQANGGVDTDANYPYKAREETCKANKNQVGTIDGYKEFKPRNMKLARLVEQQPIGSAVDAGGPDFQLYTGGIYNGACTTEVNHAVTIIGYDSEAGEDYWIIKNSYGTGWGDGGYLKLLRNDADRRGKCGIAMWPVYPTKNKNPKSN